MGELSTAYRGTAAFPGSRGAMTMRKALADMITGSIGRGELADRVERVSAALVASLRENNQGALVTARQPRLLYPGTKVTAILGGHTAYGVVDHYEYHNPNQVTFPVKFGSTTRIMLASEVTVLPDDQQPPDRKPPPCTCLMDC